MSEIFPRQANQRLIEDRTRCEPKIMFRGPLPYKFEPGRQVIEVLRGKDVIATIHTNDEGVGAIRIVTLCLLSVERSDLEGHAGASAVKIRFAGEARDDERGS
jgi:hypothetical protein